MAAKPHKMLNNASKTQKMPCKSMKNALKREKYEKMQKNAKKCTYHQNYRLTNDYVKMSYNASKGQL